MKYLYVILLLFVYTGLVYLQNVTSQANNKKGKTEKSSYINGIIKTEYGKINCTSNYNIEVELFPDNKKIIATEEIIWVNKTDYSTNEIQLHLYPNAYKNKHTLYMEEEELPELSKSEIKFKELTIAGKPADLIYIHPEIENKYDSTTAKIVLDNVAHPGDTVKIQVKYEMPLPKGIGRTGYTLNRNFFFVSQWFPKVGVFNNGKWYCSSFHGKTEFFSDFGEYSVKIKVPRQYKVGSTGYLYACKPADNNKSVYWYKQYGVHDFAFMASDEIEHAYKTYKRKDGNEVKIIGFFQPENVKFTERYLNAVYNSLRYFEENIGEYPYETITLVDVPKTSTSGAMEYPTLITTSTKVFSPEESNAPEEVTVHEFSHQYFYGIVANNEVYEAWLDEGIADYFQAKILEKYYKPEKSHFPLFRYYPLKGIQFFTYKEIPLVYSLTDMEIPPEAKLVTNYYQNIALGAITDTSYKHFSWGSYEAFTYDKPALALLSLERFIGKDDLLMILKNYYNKNKFRHPAAEDFFAAIKMYHKQDLQWFIDNYIKSPAFFDYEISSVKRIENGNNYEVLVKRIGEAISNNDIVLYTEIDTLKQYWNGKEKWKKFIFTTNNIVLGAEIDPDRKNLLDINFANNSYLINKQYGGAVRISFRWFFWMQNLLMIFGGLA